jgi:myo-inositol-1(or 4)-monophosphatase
MQLDNSIEQKYLLRIRTSLDAARRVLDRSGDLATKGSDDPAIISDAEKKIAAALRQSLHQPNEGWLCEEHADDRARLACGVVWVVDPIDGTCEFAGGIPEWSISVGLVIDGAAIAGGIYNPATCEIVLGSTNLGVTYNGNPATASNKANLDGASILASRQEFLRGDWARFSNREFNIRPLGSVAYKLALVSAGRGDATWTLSPKNEWDIAAGVALIQAAGGRVTATDGQPIRFNREKTLLPGLIASGEGLWHEVNRVVTGAR